jgi:hypothetical protein
MKAENQISPVVYFEASIRGAILTAEILARYPVRASE